MSGYTQTILLDANRLSSEEYSASNLATTNPSVFTNIVSNGVTLNVGDQVSIESAHIAQRGAGGSVIQFSGKELGEKTITTTETTNSSFIGYHKLTNIQSYSPTGYAYETSSNQEQKVKVKDNGASVVISYYKNSNGENCIGLPRNWGSPIALNSTQAGDPPSASANASFWNASDSYGKGLNTYFFNSSHIFADDYISQQAMNCCGADCTVRKLKQDNSRYTIFKKAEIVWRQNAISSASNASYLQPVSTFPDPAIHDYNRLLQKVELNVDAGYNSPSSISTEITDQLLKSDDDEVIISEAGPIVVESSIYKALPAANYFSFSLSGNSDFFNAPATVDHMPIGVGTTSVNGPESTLYLSSYSHIGFKRPDLVEAGRALNAYHANKLEVQLDLSGSGTAIIYTNFSYNDATLVNLKRFFDSQILYPELFDYATVASHDITNYAAHNTTSASLNASFRNEARFLHIGISGSGNNASGGQALGSDMYNVSFSKNDFTNDRANASDNTSQPIFFYFNNNCSHLTAEDTIGDTDENLAYGFARRWTSGGLQLVALITSKIGGIPTEHYGEQGGNAIKIGTKIGYDYHFTGYGNSAIMLSTGYNELQYYGEINYFNGRDIRQTYVGANNALFNFDTVQSRFTLSNLHSAEKVGNFYTAGDPNPSADVFAPPATAQAGQDCYKINKQLKFDSWSPSMHPYPNINLTGGTKADGTQKTFIPLSANLQSGIIYDAHSGVCIEDMGVPEQMWEQSIWGLLGFQYGQFNASGSNIKNINIRFNNDTINTSGVTTNANVTSQNGQQFHANPYGTNMFNPMITSLVEIYDDKNIKTFSAATPTDVVFPAVTIVADSTQIVANELPRKILTGYFLINSDILDAANYYQLGNPLQTMAVVGKYNGANDFVEYGGGGPVFTVTRQKTITSIKTEILNPDGETAQVGDNSGVIYRVDKQIDTDLNFAENLLKGQYGPTPK